MIDYMQKGKKKVFLSAIVPVFNEEKRISGLEKIVKYLKKQSYTWEVLVVNDGSTDKTLKMVKEMGLPIKVMSYRKNKGKGAAVRKGMLAAKGEKRLFIDIDLSTPVEEMEKIAQWWDKFPVVIGNRKASRAKIVKKQSPMRQFLGEGYIRLSQLALGMKIRDFNCGFKCFSAEAAEKIFKKQLIDRWGFDVEILYLAKKAGLKIKEVPVTWKDEENSKVKFPGALIDSLNDIWRIRKNDWQNKY